MSLIGVDIGSSAVKATAYRETTIPVVVDIRIDPNSTPIHGYQRRLADGGSYPRPGTVYELPRWRRSPPAPSS